MKGTCKTSVVLIRRNARAEQAETVRLRVFSAWHRMFAFHLDEEGLLPIEAGVRAWQDVQDVFERLRTEADSNAQGPLSTVSPQTLPQDSGF